MTILENTSRKLLLVKEGFTCFYWDLEGRTTGITANSSVLTELFSIIKKLKNSHWLNLSANWKSHLLFISEILIFHDGYNTFEM